MAFKCNISRTLSVSLLVMLLIMPCSLAWGKETHPKREMRSVWMSTAWAIDWPTNRAATSSSVTAQKKQALEYIDALHQAGFTSIFFQVRPFADRFYAKNSWTDPKTGTTYKVAEPWSAYLTGTRGTAPYGDWDPLQFWIDECHKRGMELHAWVNPYRIVSDLTKTSEDQAVSSWTITYASKTVFNPALSSTIARIQNVCRVLTGNYDIDGIVFDDYFYPDGMGSTTDTSAPDYANYQTYKNNGGKLAIADWRRDNVNRMVEAVCNTIHDIKPWVQFGISPAGAGDGSLKKNNPEGLPLLSAYCKASDWAYASLACDPIAWLRAGTVDYISPQLYWRENSSTNAFTPMSKWWSVVADRFGRHFYASHSESWLAESGPTAANVAEAAAQVGANRANTVDGNFGSVFYSAKNVMTGLSDNLRNGAFSCHAVPPAMKWKKASAQTAVTGLAKNGATLSWKAKDNMRYICYAVPMNVLRDEAASESGGLKADYIAGVTYTNTFALPSSKTDATSYWYAVATLDRYGNEWELATIGEPQPEPEGPLAVPTLILPEDASALTTSPLFSAKSSDAESLTLEIATDDEFSSPIFFAGTQGWTTNADGTMSYTLPLLYFPDGTYFWRVRASKDGREDGVSEVRSFYVSYNASATDDPDCYENEEKEEFAVLPVADSNNPDTTNDLVLAGSWSRKPGMNCLDLNPEFNRDMVARSATDQNCDMVYIVSRATSSASSESFLIRFDAATGAILPALQMTYDNDWVNGTYPANGILLDDANQLVTHTLSVAGTALSVGTVDAVTGKVTTWYSNITPKRVDHLDVYGTIADGSTWYIFAPTSQGSIYRITMNGKTIVRTEEMAATLGNAARIHAIDQNRFWVNGQQTHPTLYTFGSASPMASLGSNPDLVPQYSQATDMTTFQHDGRIYMLYQYTYANDAATTANPQGIKTQWALASGKDLNAGIEDASLLWVFPTTGAGSRKMVSGDFGAPVSVITTHAANVNAPSVKNIDLGENIEATQIFGYSYGDGLVAYELNTRTTTAVDNLPSVDKVFHPVILADGSISLGLDADTYEVYTPSGMTVDKGRGATTASLGNNGIYIIKATSNGATYSAKIAVK